MMFWVLLILTLLGVLGAAVFLMAHAVLRPPRMTDGKAAYLLKRLSPADLNMGFERLTFDINDPQAGPIRLAGWWIPHPAGGDRTVVMIHGYADAKVGAIAWAPLWRELGFHILAIDLRAHGESGGTYASAGFHERHDLDRVINRLQGMHPQKARRIVLFGVSMGAAVALATAAIRRDIEAVVADCPYAHFAGALSAHALAAGMPLPSLYPLVVHTAEWIAGADFDAVAPVNLIPTLPCAAMVVQSGEDPLVPAQDADAIDAALGALSARSVLAVRWMLPEVPHLQAFAAFPDEYVHRLAAFLAAVDAAHEPAGHAPEGHSS